MTQRSNRSWSMDDDDHDPFAEIEDDFSAGEDDLEAQLLRDKRATLCSNVNRIIDVFEPSTPPAELQQACDELVSFQLCVSSSWLCSWPCLMYHRRWDLKATSSLVTE